MKVLQVSKFFPPVLGGIEAVCWELCEGLNKAGIQTDALCANQTWRTVREKTASGYSVCRAGSMGMLLATSMAPPMALEFKRSAAHYDIVHLHMPDPMAAFALWAARPRCKVVVHWHSDVIRQRAALKVYEPLQNWLLQRADVIVATSQPYAESSAPLQPWRHKVTVIPIGISDNHSEACSARAGAIRQRFRGRRIVFALGRMTYYKGFDVLIDAASNLPEHTVVMIGGEGELLEPYRRVVAERGLAGKVHLLGHISDDELASHFEACDVFCMPSTLRAEAYGVAMVEAMVMGKPIVATDIPGSGVPWVNLDGQTGFNVGVRQPAQLSAALTRLLEDKPLRETLGAAARRRYLLEFNSDLMTRRVIELYRGLQAANG